MTKFLLWLHEWLTALLVRRKALLPEPVYLPCPDVAVEPEAVEFEAPLPEPILTALRQSRLEIGTALKRPPLPEVLPMFPDTPNGERFVIWSRGFTQFITNDGKEASKAWERAIVRAGTHRFWDRGHHAGVPRGLRQELVIPLAGE